MATLKLTIDKRRTTNDGRQPVVFRLTSNRKSTSIDAKVKLLPKEWDFQKGKVNKTHPNYKTINLFLNNRLLELEKGLIELTLKTEEVSPVALKDMLLNGSQTAKINFHEFATKEIQALKDQERFGNAYAYETAINRFFKFTGKAITLDKISYTVISDFDTHLIKEGLSRNSVAVYMREIRALMNKAIKKELMDKNKYPFANYKIKTEKTVSRAITKNDLEKIKNYSLEEGTQMWHSRNIFFLIFNLIGISFIDLSLLKTDSIQHGRVVYRRRKTGKIYSIKITSEAQRIMDLYKSEDSKYLISHLNIGDIPKEEERDAVGLKLQTCNKFLKRLGEQLGLGIQLTTYVARYTWANVAKSLNYPKDQIAEALGHEYGNRITGIYLDNYGSEIIDEMNAKVTEINKSS